MTKLFEVITLLHIYQELNVEVDNMSKEAQQLVEGFMSLEEVRNGNYAISITKFESFFLVVEDEGFSSMFWIFLSWWLGFLGG